jgi:hypothetical protein
LDLLSDIAVVVTRERSINEQREENRNDLFANKINWDKLTNLFVNWEESHKQYRIYRGAGRWRGAAVAAATCGIRTVSVWRSWGGRDRRGRGSGWWGGERGVCQEMSKGGEKESLNVFLIKRRKDEFEKDDTM